MKVFHPLSRILNKDFLQNFHDAFDQEQKQKLKANFFMLVALKAMFNLQVLLMKDLFE